MKELVVLRLLGPKAHYRQLFRADQQNYVLILVYFSNGLMVVLRIQMPKYKIRQPVVRKKKKKENKRKTMKKKSFTMDKEEEEEEREK